MIEIPMPDLLWSATPEEKLLAVAAVLHRVPIDNTDPNWRMPDWAKQAIRLASAIARSQAYPTLLSLWNSMIFNGAPAYYVESINQMLNKGRDENLQAAAPSATAE